MRCQSTTDGSLDSPDELWRRIRVLAMAGALILSTSALVACGSGGEQPGAGAETEDTAATAKEPAAEDEGLTEGQAPEKKGVPSEDAAPSEDADTPEQRATPEELGRKRAAPEEP